MKLSFKTRLHVNKAVNILERIVYVRLPVFLRYELFDDNMRNLLANSKFWLETWDGVSKNIKRLFEALQKSSQFKKFERQFKVMKLIILSSSIIVTALTLYSVMALFTLPLILFLFPIIYYLRGLLAERYLVKPNRKSIECLVKAKKSDIVKLINFLKSL